MVAGSEKLARLFQFPVLHSHLNGTLRMTSLNDCCQYGVGLDEPSVRYNVLCFVAGRSVGKSAMSSLPATGVDSASSDPCSLHDHDLAFSDRRRSTCAVKLFWLFS